MLAPLGRLGCTSKLLLRDSVGLSLPRLRRLLRRGGGGGGAIARFELGVGEGRVAGGEIGGLAGVASKGIGVEPGDMESDGAGG